jgi:RND family efflux transporter MFP subunit
MKRVFLIAAPFLVLGLAGFGAYAMFKSRPDPEKKPATFLPPLVRIETVEMQDLRLTVASQGTVGPRTESQLVPEVSGRVTWVADSFVSGGFFEAGDVLVRIDPHDYEQAVVRARADVSRAELRLAQEEAEAEVAAREWQDLGAGEEATPLTLRIPQVEDARSSLEAAEAAVEKAKRDLDRTEVRALYAGRVRAKLVDVGQFVTMGTPLGTIYAVDFAEIRLPLPNADLAFLDLPLVYRGAGADERGPAVTLTARFAGQEFSWNGRVVRTEGEIDPTSRLVHVVARVRDPYARGADPDRPPLAVGMFVGATIEGVNARDVAVLPRAALRGRDEVLVVDSESRLRFRKVDLLRATRENIVVRGGLEDGERVCLSALEAVTDGMRVRVRDEAGGGRAS